jgi:hypothetical protein
MYAALSLCQALSRRISPVLSASATTEIRKDKSDACEQTGHLTGQRISGSVMFFHRYITLHRFRKRGEFLPHEVKLLLVGHARTASLPHGLFKLRLAHEKC